MNKIERLNNRGTFMLVLFIAGSAIVLLLMDVLSNSSRPSLKAISFNYGSEINMQKSSGQIDATVSLLIKDPTSMAVLTGHTGPEGDEEANTELSRQRAEAVKSILVEKGIPEDRIITLGAGGELAPVRKDSETDAQYSGKLPRVTVTISDRRLLTGPSS